MDPDGTASEVFRAFELRGWDQEGRPEAYHRFFGELTTRTIEALLEAAAAGTGTRLLDVGSGPGYVAAAAAERGAAVVGVGAAARMLTLAAQRYPGLEFRQADAEALPFPDGSFEAVVANFLVPHLARPETAVAEFVRVLRPGGRLALTAWGLAEGTCYRVYNEAVQAVGAQPPPDLPAGPSFFAYADEAAFAGLLRSAGLREVEVRSLMLRHPATSPREVWEGLVRGTVRNSAFIRGQPAAMQERIRDEFERRLDGQTRDGKPELLAEVKLAHGTSGDRTASAGQA
jgi:SAM-dependent methyltransferase